MSRSSILTLLLASLCSTALAQSEQPADQSADQVQTVEVKGARERLVPYKESYELARKVRDASSGRVAFGLRLVPAKPDVRLDDIRLWLGEDGDAAPVAVREGGLFVVPINDKVAASGGHYSINRKKGDLNVRVAIMPNVPKDTWTIGLMQQVANDGKAAVNKLLPWYMRAFGIGVDAVAVCGKNAGMPIQVMNGAEVAGTVTADKKGTNDIGQPVYCKHFTNAEKFDAAYKVVIPEGAEVLLM